MVSTMSVPVNILSGNEAPSSLRYLFPVLAITSLCTWPSSPSTRSRRDSLESSSSLRGPPPPPLLPSASSPRRPRAIERRGRRQDGRRRLKTDRMSPPALE